MMKRIFTFTIVTLFLVSCNFFGISIAKKGKSYSISKGNESFIFIVTNIRYDEDETSVYESIDYKLYKGGQNRDQIHTSYIKYSRVKNNDGSYTLNKIEGTNKISRGNILFTWSYGSDDHIYLYLEDEAKLKKMSYNLQIQPTADRAA